MGCLFNIYIMRTRYAEQLQEIGLLPTIHLTIVSLIALFAACRVAIGSTTRTKTFRARAGELWFRQIVEGEMPGPVNTT